MIGMWATALVLCLSQAAIAQSGNAAPLKSLRSGVDAAGWEAVGRLDVAGAAFCTAALIAPDVVLTAAHCLFDPRTKAVVGARDVVFHVGYRNGVASQSVSAHSYVLHPKFEYDGDARGARVTNDVALVQLNHAMTTLNLKPFSTGDRPRKGSDVAVVSYGKSRKNTPTLEQACSVLARRSGMLVLDCNVEFGSSGAPVFQRDLAGNMQVVSVISSAMDLNGKRYALGTDLQRPLAVLQDLLAQQPPAPATSTKPQVRVLGANRTNGAKFLRP